MVGHIAPVQIKPLSPMVDVKRGNENKKGYDGFSMLYIHSLDPRQSPMGALISGYAGANPVIVSFLFLFQPSIHMH